MCKFFSIAMGCVLFFISCNKEDDGSSQTNTETDPKPVGANFYGLTIGNTWTYSLQVYNTALEAYENKDYSITNTISVTEVLNNQTYFTITSATEGAYTCTLCLTEIGNMSVRDSLGYLVKKDGTILFSKTNTTPHLLEDNDWGTIYGELITDPVVVLSPAGTFTALVNKRYAILNDGARSVGVDGTYRVDEIGLVQKSITTVTSETPQWLLKLESYTKQ